MSKLFNLSRILENHTPDLVRFVNPKTFLSEGVSLVESYDKAINVRKRELYSALLEADSVKEENDKFAEFFKEFKKIIDDNCRKAQQLAAQFNVTITAFADANKDLYDISRPDPILAHYVEYKGVEFANLLSDDIPNIDPYKAFKDEFGMLGKLLQDLSPLASEDQKAAVIATVCNNLSKKLNDDWINKCVEKIAHCDECSKNDFAKAIYNKFVVDKEAEYCLDTSMIKQAKLALMNHTQYIQVINKATDNLCDGLTKVADEVGSLFFRNQDHHFELTSDQEGVKDTTYHFNDYGFNQLNKFICTKISQINELFNLYIIALSIKMDCIYKYLQQCKDVIETAEMAVKLPDGGSVNADPDDIEDHDYDEESSGNGDIEMNEDDSEEQEDDEDKSNDEPASDEALDQKPEDIQNDSPEDTEGKEAVNEEEPENEAVDFRKVDNSEYEAETEAYLFEAEILQINRMIEAYEMQSWVYTALHEDATSGRATRVAAAGKLSIKEKVKNLVNKFISLFTNNYNKRIDFVVAHSDMVKKTKIPDGWTIQRLDTSRLINVKLQEFNPADKYNDEDEYLNAKYGNILDAQSGQATSVKERILSKALSKTEAQYTHADRIRGLDWLTRDCKTANNNIQKFSDAYTREVNKNEPAHESGMFVNNEATTLAYFMEDNATGAASTSGDTGNSSSQQTSQGTQGNDAPKDNADDAVNEANKQKDIYTNANMKLMMALMNVYSMKTKKELKFLEKLAGAKQAKE